MKKRIPVAQAASSEMTPLHQHCGGDPVLIYRTEQAAALRRWDEARAGRRPFVTSGRCPLTRVSGRPAA